MQRIFMFGVLAVLLPVAISACDNVETPDEPITSPHDSPMSVDPGPDLYKVEVPPIPGYQRKNNLDPVVIGGCRLSVIEKEEVPSERDGVVLFIGSEIKPGEEVPPERVIDITIDGQKLRFRRLKEGDIVKPGQLLARLDDRVSRDESAKKRQGVVTAQAELETSHATLEEAKARLDAARQLRAKNAMSAEDYRAAVLNVERYKHEITSKGAAVEASKLDRRQSETVLGMHEIRSSIHGEVRHIYKSPGEAVKSAPTYEPLFEIQNLDRLRVEGRVPVQFKPYLHKGMPVVIEASRSSAPLQTFVGHLQEVTGVAVAKDGRIVSSSLDKTLRIWDRRTRHEQHILRHTSPVEAVACTPRAAAVNRCVSGTADGSIYLWDLDAKTPTQSVLETKHQGAVECVAFSTDGTYFATGGEDRIINIFETATGKFLYGLHGHSGAITSVRFTPQARLISAARDNTLNIWQLGQDGGKLINTIDRRSGDVTTLGVTPDGQHVMFDPWQSKHLRVLSVPEGETKGVLNHPSGSGRFTTFAQFSPDAELIVTAGNSDGRLELWRSPLRSARARVLRDLVPASSGEATAAAFAPDGSFLVTGTRDRNVLVWSLPQREELDEQMVARISYIENALDVASQQVRIWAELDNARRRLMPGDTVTMVRFLEE